MVGGPLAKMQSVANNQASSTNYIMIVDRSTHRVGVFKGRKNSWTNVKYYKCCVGKPSTPTISGTYTVGSRVNTLTQVLKVDAGIILRSVVTTYSIQ